MKPGQEDPPWNAARRLHAILTAARQQAGERPAHEVWAEVLGAPKGDTIAVYRALVEVDSLISDLEALLRRIPSAGVDLYVGRVAPVRKALRVPGLQTAWSTQLSLVPETALVAVEYAAHAIEQTSISETKISDDDLTSLRKQADDLFTEVEKSPNLDSELQRVLLSCLEAFRRALVHYRIRGAAGLRETVQHNFADLAVYLIDQKPEPHGWRVVRNVLRFFRRVDDIVGRVMKYTPALRIASRLALPPDVADALHEAIQGEGSDDNAGI